MIDRPPTPLATALGPILDRLPPHSLDAEVAVLASVLLDGEILGNLIPLIGAEDFYRSHNRLLYESMLRVYDSGEPVLPVALVEDLRQRGLLEKAGGVEYLASFAGQVDSPVHAEYFAKIVREKAIARALISTTGEIQQAAYEQALAGEDLLELAESRIYALGRRRQIQDASGVADVLQRAFEEIQQSDGTGGGIQTGFYHFDEMTGGLRPGELIVVAGRPSMGKSTFALNVAAQAAIRQKRSVVIFSMEMTSTNIVKNILCAEARFDASRLRRGRFLGDEDLLRLRDAAAPLFDAPLFLDDTPSLTPTLLRAKARRIKARDGLDLIIVDYLQLMDGGAGIKTIENRQQEITYISRSLKQIARELEVPVISLSQLNRMAEQRDRPRLADLRESGAIEQDADVICLLYRPEYYLKATADEFQRSQVAGKAEVIIGKQRNGPTGTVHLHFHKEWMLFSNPAPEAIP